MTYWKDFFPGNSSTCQDSCFRLRAEHAKVWSLKLLRGTLILSQPPSGRIPKVKVPVGGFQSSCQPLNSRAWTSPAVLRWAIGSRWPRFSCLRLQVNPFQKELDKEKPKEGAKDSFFDRNHKDSLESFTPGSWLFFFFYSLGWLTTLMCLWWKYLSQWLRQITTSWVSKELCVCVCGR